MDGSSRRAPFKPINFQPLPTQKDRDPSDGNLISTPVKVFPSNFNPRKDLNMHHQEKVDKWIVMVPTYPSSDLNECWDNSCYSPLIGLSDRADDEDFQSVEFDFANFRDVLEFQSRAITFQSNRLYFRDMEVVKKPQL